MRVSVKDIGDVLAWRRSSHRQEPKRIPEEAVIEISSEEEVHQKGLYAPSVILSTS